MRRTPLILGWRRWGGHGRQRIRRIIAVVAKLPGEPFEPYELQHFADLLGNLRLSRSPPDRLRRPLP